MARRRQTIGGDDNDIVDAYTQAYFKRGQQEDPRMATAIQLLGLQQGQQEAALNREEKARAQQALEAYQQGQLGTEKERVGIAKSEAEANALERAAAADAREQAAARTETLTREAGVREAEKNRLEAEGKKQELRQRVFHDVVLSGQPLTPYQQAVMGKVDPEYAQMAKDMQEEAINTAVTQNLDRFKGMTPEARKAILQNPVAVKELGGIEGYKRLMANFPEEPAAAPQQGFWSKMFSGGTGEATGAPPGPTAARPSVGEQLISPEGVRIGDILAPRVTVDPELRSGKTRGAAPVEPAPDYTNLYGPGYPSAKPDYMYGIQTPVAESVINRVNADPRFQPAEDQIMKAAMDWWHRQTGAGQPPQFPAYGWMGTPE